MTMETASLLQQYVEQGGKLIFGARTGYKDDFGKVRMQEMPGPVAELCGIIVEDFTMITGTEKPAHLVWMEEMSSESLGIGSAEDEVTDELIAEGFNDILQVKSETVEVIASYKDKYYAGKPALTRNRVGKGEAYYYGAAFNESVAGKLLPCLSLKSPKFDWCELPQCVELAIRSNDEGDVIFLLNYSPEAVQLKFNKQVLDQITGHYLVHEVELEAYGVIVIRS